MSKNAAKIRSGIRSLVHKPHEIISGTVVSGSVDADAYVMTVQPADDGEPITGVRFNAITDSDRGMILFPADNSNVIIGSIEGPGEWVLLRCSEISRAFINLNSMSYEMDTEHINIQNGNVIFNMSNSLFKMKTDSEDLFSFLKDLVTYITALTVPTPAGTSGMPVNIADFNSLLSRLNNLLTN